LIIDKKAEAGGYKFGAETLSTITLAIMTLSNNCNIQQNTSTVMLSVTMMSVIVSRVIAPLTKLLNKITFSSK
jgi:hypothetical protein